MSIQWIYLLYIAVFILLVLLVPQLVKRYYYQRLMNDLHAGNFKMYVKHLDSLLAKVNFSAFERESMRLSMYEMQEDMKKADQQLQFMEHMRLSRKQKARLGEQGFYIYLAQGKIKKAAHMLDLVREYGTGPQAENLEIQYSILLKKEARYIDALKERHAKLKDANGAIQKGLEGNAGTYEYLIGLQYSYKKDHPNTKLWLSQALGHLKGTPYEEQIEAILAA